MSSAQEGARTETRQLLLDAAREEFYHRRVADVSLDEIAQRAGYTKGAIYSNFASKTDLVFAVVERHIIEHDLDYVAAIEGASVDEIGTAIAEKARDVFEHDQGFLRLLTSVWADAVYEPDAAARFVELQRTHRRTVGLAIENRLRDLGVGHLVDAQALATGVVSLSMATMLHASVDGDVSVADVHRQSFDLIVEGVVSLALRADPANATGAG